MNKKLPAWIVLTVIALVAALALAFTYDGTKDRIAAQEAEKAVAVRQELLPEAQRFDEDKENAVFIGKDASDAAVGYVHTITVQGFGGPVEITVATDSEGEIKGVRVGGAGFQETAGLGAKSKEPAFYEQFTGKTVPTDLTKNGGEIDAITAATITSSAVVRGVNDAVKNIAVVAGFKIAEPEVAVEELGGGRYAASMQGFAGPVYVELALDGSGTITDIVIGDERFSETSGFGARAKEESFWGQYIGKGGTELTFGEGLDAMSGATITSNAVNSAVNLILLYVNDPAAYAAQQAAKAAAESIDVSIPEGAETLTGEGNGLSGKFTVDVSVDENGAINGIRVNDTDSEMDAPFLAKCQNDSAFLGQFIGKTAPIAEDDIDVATGATVSSKGIVAAVNAAFAPAAENNDAADENTVDVSIPEGAETLTGEGNGLSGKFTVDVSVDENGAINGIRVNDTDSEMDASFLAKCQNDSAFLAQFIGKTAPIAEDDIDVVTGATVSSKGIVAAVNAALEAAPVAAPEATAEPAADDNVYTAEGDGLTGKFPVTVTVDENGAIAAVAVGESASDMDASFLAKCRTEEFLNQFVGKTAPVAESDIDVVTGATVSSKGIVAAVNAALENVAAAAPEATAEPAADDNVYTAEGDGLTGKFPVTVTVDEKGAIAAVTVGDSASDMDASFLAKCRTEEFLNQFVGKTAPVAESDIDVVTGATVSSKGIVAAVNAALEAAK